MTYHPSFGAQLKVDWAGGTAYSTIAQVKDINGPNITRGVTDVTCHDSPDQGYREKLPGLPDAGQVTFDLEWDPNDSMHIQGAGTGLLGDFEQDGCTLAAWQMTLPGCGGSPIWTFDGFVVAASGVTPVEGSLRQSLTVEINGKPSLAVS